MPPEAHRSYAPITCWQLLALRSVRFGRYDLIDCVAVLLGSILSGEPTLQAFYERLAPWTSLFIALFGRNQLFDGFDKFVEHAMMLNIAGGKGTHDDAHDLDFETIRPIDLNTAALTPGSQATPFSTLLWAVVSGDMAAVEAQIIDDIEWGLMPYNKVLKGKEEVIPWFRAASADQKQPIVITNVATKDWGVFEYWNIGTVSQEVITFGNEQKWPWPKDPKSFLGQQYRVAQCFVYHINPQGKIDFMRQYLDTGSVWAQFT